RRLWSAGAWRQARQVMEPSPPRTFDHDTGTNRRAVLPPHRVEVVLVQRIQAQRALAGLLLQEPGPVLLAPRHPQAVQQSLGGLQGDHHRYVIRSGVTDPVDPIQRPSQTVRVERFHRHFRHRLFSSQLSYPGATGAGPSNASQEPNNVAVTKQARHTSAPPPERT